MASHAQTLCLYFQIGNLSFVANTVPNGLVSVDRPMSGCPECDSFRPERDNWGLARISQEDALPENRRWPLYTYEKEDMDVDIYVLDTGILETHEEFEPGRARWGFTGWDAAYWDRYLDKGPNFDYYGHGTHVAGTAAGNKYGVAKTANVIAVKVLASDGYGTFADIIDGLFYVVNSASRSGRKSIINMSLGGWWDYYFDYYIRLVIDYYGIPIVSSAGNGGNSCYYLPAGIGGTGGNGITVAASNRDDEMSSFSSYGTCVDVIAPGECIRSAHSSCDSCYRTWAGTSMSAPHVTGVVARLMAATGVTSPLALKEWVTGTAAADKITMEWYQSYYYTPNLLLQSSCFK